LPHHQAALKANPKSLSYWTAYGDNRLTLAENHLDLGDHERAAAAIEEFVAAIADLPKGDELDYHAASHLARCAAMAGQDDRLTEANRKQKANDYARRAVERLRAAVRRGFKDLQKIKSDHDLDGLRTREDFQRFLAEVEAKGKD
jgi:ATP/maltotriose-dependent transcriptional regulator MalT